MSKTTKWPLQTVDEDLLPPADTDADHLSDGISWEETQRSPQAAAAPDVPTDAVLPRPSGEDASPVLRRSWCPPTRHMSRARPCHGSQASSPPDGRPGGRAVTSPTPRVTSCAASPLLGVPRRVRPEAGSRPRRPRLSEDDRNSSPDGQSPSLGRRSACRTELGLSHVIELHGHRALASPRAGRRSEPATLDAALDRRSAAGSWSAGRGRRHASPAAVRPFRGAAAPRLARRLFPAVEAEDAVTSDKTAARSEVQQPSRKRTARASGESAAHVADQTTARRRPVAEQTSRPAHEGTTPGAAGQSSSKTSSQVAEPAAEHSAQPAAEATGRKATRQPGATGPGAQETKRRRLGPDLCEELRRGLEQGRAVPTVTSQERRRWMRRVASAGRAGHPQQTGSEQRASDWLRRIRHPEVTPEKSAPSAAELSLSVSKAHPKRRGLVQKLRRLLKRSGAFARMSRHRSDGSADQACLCVHVERAERQAGSLMVVGRTADLSLVQVVLPGGQGHRAVAAGHRLMLYTPWQRLQPGTGPPVLLPVGGTGAEPGSPPPAVPTTTLHYSCPCPRDLPLPKMCVRTFPQAAPPLKQSATQSHLTTVRSASPRSLPPSDGTTILAALGCGGDVVRPIDATVLHVCQYRCPADSQTSDGAEHQWCWSLLVADLAGTVAEVMLLAHLLQLWRAVCRRNSRVTLSGLVVRERTTSDQCPALASMILQLTGQEPSFTYILQALQGDSVISARPERVSQPRRDQPADAEAADRRTGASPIELPSTGDLEPGGEEMQPSAGLGRPLPAGSQELVPGGQEQPSAGLGRPLPVGSQELVAGGRGQPSAGGRQQLVCRVLAPLAGAVLVLTSDGTRRLAVLPETGVLLIPGQTVRLAYVWHHCGRLLLDRYSTFERLPDESLRLPKTALSPLTPSCQPGQLVQLTGVLTGVDEELSSIWTACSICGSDDLTEAHSEQFCNYCLLDSPSLVTKMELKAEVTCAMFPAHFRVTVHLLQGTINSLLGCMCGDVNQGYELSSVLGHSLSDVHCVVTERQSDTLGLHEVRL